MNKFLQKLAKIFLGLSMAAGVGVAIGSNREASKVDADQVTHTFTSKSWADSTSSWTTDKDASQMNNGYVQVTTSVTGAGATSKNSFSNVSNVTITFHTNASNGAGSISVQIGSNTAQSYSVTKTGGTTDRTASFDYATTQSGKIKFVVNCTTNSIYVLSISITTASGGGGTAPDGAASSTSFSTTGKYVLAATHSSTKYYLSSVSPLGTQANWGVCSTTEASGYRFSLSGSTASGSTTIQATTVISGTTYYLQPLITGKFQLSTSTYSLTLKQDGTIFNPSSSSYRVRYNYNNGSGGFRWYNSEVNNTEYGYFYEAVVTYTISYNSNGGSGTMSSSSGTNPSVSSCSFTAPTGKTFSHWNTAADGSGTTYAAGATPKKDLTLYAIWSWNTYSVTASISHGSFTGSATATHGSAYSGTIVPDTANDYVLPTSLDSVTISGSTTSNYTYDSSTGAFSIAAAYVTGPIGISAECVESGTTEYEFSYSLSHCSIQNAPESMFSNQIKELVIVPDDHYKLPSESANKVSVTGAIDWYYDEDDGTITIDGADDDLIVTVECILKATNTITNSSLVGVSAASGNPGTVEEGATVVLTYTANSGYGLPTSTGVTVTGAASSTWTQSSGQLQITGGTSAITVSIEGVEIELSSITLGTKKTSYNLGDDFVLPTVTANFNVGPSQNVTNDVEFDGPIIDGVVTGSGTITISYTYEPTGTEKTTSYSITATAIEPSSDKFVKVTSGTVTSGKYLIVNESNNVALNGGINSTSYDVVNNNVSVVIEDNEIEYTDALNSASFTYDASGKTLKSAAGYYIYRAATSSGMNASTSKPSEAISISISSGNAIISNTYNSNTMRLRYNAASDQNRFRFYSSDSVQAIQIYKFQEGTPKEFKWITATLKPGNYYQGSSVSASDFVVTAHYNDGNTDTVTTGITVTGGYLENVGDNEVTLTYSGKSYTVNVVAAIQTAVYTGLSWAQGEYTIIDGHAIDFDELGTVTAEYDNGESPSVHKDLAHCSVATYTKSGNTYTKVSDLSDGATITSSLHGKYLGVTYTDTYTFTAYSSDPIYVVEAIEDVYGKVETTIWSKTTSVQEGDVVTFVNEDESKYAKSTGSSIINSDSYEGSVTSPLAFTVGKVGNYYTFHAEGGYLGNHSTGTSGNNYAYLDSTIDTTDNKNYFTVTFEEGNVIITSVYDSDRSLQLRSGTPDRFCFYGTTQLSIQLYKGVNAWVPSGQSIANTNAIVQKAVLEYAVHFNETMACIQNGSTVNVSGKWEDLTDDFDDLLGEFRDSNLVHCKALFQGADAVDGGDTLQDMLARYEYIVGKYKTLDDFLHTETDRPEVQRSAAISPLTLIGVNGENANTIAVIVIISMVSVTAIGGYFFLRRRKENI